ncbi:hypothetical protein ACTXT7_000630 [Hymenolepis weldensis]
MRVSGKAVNFHVRRVRDLVIDVRRYTFSDVNGKQHWLVLVNKRVTTLGGFPNKKPAH